MNLPVLPPQPPMLARLARELPVGPFLYEPKWDGFRAMAFREGTQVDLRSRNGKPLARYFPELVDGLRGLRTDRVVLDGEIILMGPDGFDFTALLGRLHPAPSRVARLSRELPATFVGFDLLAVGNRDVTGRPFEDRRSLLEGVLSSARPPVLLTPVTGDPGEAAGWLDRFQGGGIDGVVAKERSQRYLAGKRAMVKVKLERTADCVVAGYRLFADRPVLSSLLLGLQDDLGDFHHVGVAAAFTEARRRELLEELRSLRCPLAEHPWRGGFLAGGNPMGRLKGAAGAWTPDMGLDWVPVRPELVCEVAYDQLDGDRFRHSVRFRRWRPDRDPASCRFDQFAPSGVGPAEVLAGS